MICITPDCQSYSEGNTQHCASCNRANRKSERLALREPKVHKINKVADKRAVQLRQYYKLRDQYLAIHQQCEVSHCREIAVDIHHQKGRENELLLDTNLFMAICRTHHTYYTKHSKEAIEEGYSVSRNQTTSDAIS